MSALEGISPQDMILNPLAGRPVDSRQARNVKAKARSKAVGSDELTFLNESIDTIPRGFEVDGRRYTNYIID